MTLVSCGCKWVKFYERYVKGHILGPLHLSKLMIIILIAKHKTWKIIDQVSLIIHYHIWAVDPFHFSDERIFVYRKFLKSITSCNYRLLFWGIIWIDICSFLLHYPYCVFEWWISQRTWELDFALCNTKMPKCIYRIYWWRLHWLYECGFNSKVYIEITASQRNLKNHVCCFS